MSTEITKQNTHTHKPKENKVERATRHTEETKNKLNQLKTKLAKIQETKPKQSDN